MRNKLATVLLALACFPVANADEIDTFATKYNKIFDGVMSVCDSNKAPSAEGLGYKIAEATKIDGNKEILRVPQNTLGQFKKIEGKYAAEFHSYRWLAKTKSSKTEKSILKLEESKEGLPRLNMYRQDGGFQASHALGHAEDGSVEFVLESSSPLLKDAESEFAYYVIRASKSDGIIKYGINDLVFKFSKEIREAEEKKTGRKFYSDKPDEVRGGFIGNIFTIEEVREIAARYGVKGIELGDQPWQNCPLPTEEEVRSYYGNFGKTSANQGDNRKPSSLEKNKKK